MINNDLKRVRHQLKSWLRTTYSWISEFTLSLNSGILKGNLNIVKMRAKIIILTYVILFCFSLNILAAEKIWIEAEQFANLGGWVVDPQFADQMGSSYLLAHGLGLPVMPASTTVEFPSKGKYNLWVRTKDWAPFPKGPGKFQISINQDTIAKTFGSDGIVEWHWQYGGEISIRNVKVQLTIIDSTGFDGRIDAFYFSKSKNDVPPAELNELTSFRKKMLKLPSSPIDAGEFDLVVAGGGIAGICASIQAARLGLKVALIQNRPVLGGNGSSEIRLALYGDMTHNLYPKIGQIVRELDTGIQSYNGKPEDYGDDLRLSKVKNEKNISLFLSTHIYDVEKKGNQINAALGRNIITGEEYRFTAHNFVDCTGDGSLGYFAGANYKMGREGFDETKEPKAPMFSDGMVLGSTTHWKAELEDTVSNFPVCDWALQFSDSYYLDRSSSAWNWETGFYWDSVKEAERIRDHKFRAIYGNWSFLKNNKSEKYANWKLKWVGYILGKRESRRLVGDIFLTELDINNRVQYSDACVTTTWGIDLHYPNLNNSQYFPGEEFIGYAEHDKNFEPYHFPYRCLYSNNISNLFMAGRNISVSHIALGTVRVMKTTGMMGEVVGIAAYLCTKHKCSPREVYQNHLDEFLGMLQD